MTTRLYNQVIDYVRNPRHKTSDPIKYKAMKRKKESFGVYRAQLRAAVRQYWAGAIEQKDLELYQYAIHGPTLKKKWNFTPNELKEFVSKTLTTL